MCRGVCKCKSLWVPEESIDSPGAQLRGGCKPLKVGAGNLGPLEKQQALLSHLLQASLFRTKIDPLVQACHWEVHQFPVSLWISVDLGFAKL